MFKNKKGLASGLIIIVLSLFTLALANLITLFLWNQFYDVIDAVDNETIDQSVKDKIAAMPMMGWGDKIFVYTFIALLIAYLISSSSIPTERPVFLLVFLGWIIFVTILAMAFSNAYTYISDFDILQSTAASLPFTDYFMRYLPFISLFTGAIGAIIFYARRQTGLQSGGENFDFE